MATTVKRVKKSTRKNKTAKSTDLAIYKQPEIKLEKMYVLIHQNNFGVSGKTHEEILDYLKQKTSTFKEDGWNYQQNLDINMKWPAEKIINKICSELTCWRFFQIDSVVKQ